MSKNYHLVVGVDEAGRGPLAGPITLAVFAAPQNYKNKLIKILSGTTPLKLRGASQIKDSKQLSPARRYEIYRRFKKLKKENSGIFFCVSHVSHKIIDKKGISYATRLGIKRCLSKLEHAPKAQSPTLGNFGYVVIRLDGSLKAPEKYKNQKTIIGGDSKDIFIACASIVAKVRRDRLMCRLGSQLPLWAFQIHKGYGTPLHYKLLAKHGLSDLHRRTFCQKLTK